MFVLVKNILRWFLAKYHNPGVRMDFNSKVDRLSNIGKQSRLVGAIIQKSETGEKLEAIGAGIFRSKIGSRCKIKKANCYSVTFGDEVQVGENCIVSHSTIEKRTYLAPNVMLFHSQIGSYCSIGPGAIIGHAEHPVHFLSTSPLFYNPQNSFGEQRFILEAAHEFRETTIGHDVWIGANAFIKSGVTLGTGAVIGAHAVVTKDVPPYAIVAGVPARIIRMRFKEEIIRKLAFDAWWTLTEQDLEKYSKEFNPE